MKMFQNTYTNYGNAKIQIISPWACSNVTGTEGRYQLYMYMSIFLQKTKLVQGKPRPQMLLKTKIWWSPLQNNIQYANQHISQHHGCNKTIQGKTTRMTATSKQPGVGVEKIE